MKNKTHVKLVKPVPHKKKLNAIILCNNTNSIYMIVITNSIYIYMIVIITMVSMYNGS